MRRAALLAILFAACTGEVQPIGIDQPIRVQGATLRHAPLPGGPDAEGPRVTAIETTGGVWSQGQLDRTLAGRVSEEAFAVGFELVGLGSGFWTVPAGAPDPAFPGERAFDVRVDVGGGVPPGVHTLRVVAIDEEGRGGPWSEIQVCVTDPRVPDNLNACDASIPPPDAVIVLSWDVDADLDLVLVTPEGKTVDARHPTTAFAGEGRPIPSELLRDPRVGRLDGDSLAECRPDGRRSESVTWQEPAHVPGLYLVYANLYDACGHASVHFVLRVYRRAQIDGSLRLSLVEERAGLAMDLAANGGAGAPLYLGAVDLP